MTRLKARRAKCSLGFQVGTFFLLVLHLGSLNQAHATGWMNVRIPVSAHFGPPGLGIESGLDADFLSVFTVSSERSRLGVGPYAELRTLGISHLGVGGGIEVLAIGPDRTTLGLGGKAGFSKWLNVAEGGGLTGHLALSVQLRSSGSGGGFVHTTAVFIRAGRSFESDDSEFTAGIELGGDPFSSLVALFMQHSGW